jgi:phytoene dehydrogenase-like protein
VSQGRASYDAVVVGGGHNGLVTAGYLARAGMRVLVLERRDRTGGAATTAEIAPGVRAPTLAHTVGRLRRPVIRDLELARHGLRLVHPDPLVVAPQPDGPPIMFWADPRRTADEVKATSPADGEAWVAFDRKVRALASLVDHVNALTPPDPTSPSLADAIGGFKVARALRGRWRAAEVREAIRVIPMAVAGFVAEALDADSLRAVVAARGVQYTAMGPWSAGTTAVLLNDTAGSGGGAAGQSTLALGGPGALADALAFAVRALGGDIRCEAEVSAITTRGERATGVVLAGGEEIPAPIVVSGLDPKRTLLELIDPVVLGPTLGWRVGNLRMPGTVSKVNLALSGIPRFPGLDGEDQSRLLGGRIVFATGVDDLERAYDGSKYGRISEEPYLEATFPTLSDPSLAPEGTHVMSVLAQWTPFRLGDGDWGSERESLGDLVLKTLERHAPGIGELVTARQVLTPLDLESEYGLTEGHPLHGEPGLDQYFAWRPLLGYARYRMPLRGLYLCGSGAHPGGGITGGPGANAAREILADHKRPRR